MCGIFGSTKLEQFKTLYKMNQSRGDFAFGGVYCKKKEHSIQKSPGIADITPPKSNRYSYYLGHTQAPTSSVREFNEDTTHPFIHEDWVVAHNGVLSNAEELKKKFLLPNVNDVDTSCIPALMKYFYVDTGDAVSDEIRAITTSLGMLEGTFSCWIFNKKSNHLYITRTGSTLYFEPTQGNFSSALDPYRNYKSVPEGVLFMVQGKNINEVGHFECDSPYFIL